MPNTSGEELGPKPGHYSGVGDVGPLGRVLFERFLVMKDVSDPVYAGFVRAYLVKDLKDFCRKVVLRTFLWEDENKIDPGPSLQDVCRILAKEQHPNIEPVLEAGHLFDGSPFSVTEHCEGTTLDRLIDGPKRLELGRIAGIVRSLSEALAFVHANGLLHCDIRPGNVLLIGEAEYEPEVRLTNFGCAWPIDSRGEGLSRLPADDEAILYAAPELHTKLGYRAPSSDVFSLAVLAHRMMIGRLPFRDHDRGELLSLMSKGLRSFPSDERTDISRETDNLIAAALQFEPAWRPQDIGEWGAALAGSLVSRSPFPVTIYTPNYSAAPAKPEPEAAIPSVEYDDLSAPIPTLSNITKSGSRHRTHLSDRSVALSLIILLLAGALSIPVGQIFFSSEENVGGPPAAVLTREPEIREPKLVRFWFASKQAGTFATEAEGAASFVLGNSELGIDAERPGILSVIAEISDADGQIIYRRLAVSESSDRETGGSDGSASVRVRPSIDPAAGAVNAVWIAWISAEKPEPEQIAAVDDPEGVIEGEPARRLRHFLERNRNARLEVEPDATAGVTKLTGLGDRIVYRIDLDRQ
ncbi:MAG: serine/threonine protein kinase [Pyrinomonadaceae bacterium]